MSVVYLLKKPKTVRTVSGVYMLQCCVTSKVYIGCTRDLSARLYGHVTTLRRGAHDNIKLQSTWNKYGEENFLFRVLAYTEDIFEVEKKFIARYDAYRNGMNMTLGGEGVGSNAPEIVARRTATLRKTYRDRPELRALHSVNAKQQQSRLSTEERSAVGKARSLNAAARIASMTPEELAVRSKMLSEASKKRWANVSVEERKKFGRMLVESRGQV